MVGTSSLESSSTTQIANNFNFVQFFNAILKNNIDVDIFGYILGGLTLYIGTFITLFSSNILETSIIATLDAQNGISSFYRYILPQFFPETMGYVFGIAISMAIADILLSYLQSYLRNQESGYFLKRSRILLNNAGLYFILSISCLILGALIESSLKILNI